MNDFQDSVMVAFLPTTSEWCHIKLPHMTLVYAGVISELKPSAHNELAKVALSLAMTCETFTLVVLGIEIFGKGEEEVEVFRLRPDPEVIAMRSVVEAWNASEYSFNPHVTVGPIGSTKGDIPNSITFDRIAVGWGESLLPYKLLRSTR